MTANLERRKETLRLAHEYDLIILEGILLTPSSEGIYATRFVGQMIRTFTYTMVKPQGTRRTLSSNSSNQSSEEYSDSTAFRKFCRPVCGSGLLRAQDRYSTRSTLM